MIPLSFAQQRLWFLGELEGASATYNIPLAIRLHGDLDQEALRLALTDVVERHEILRTVYPVGEQGPHQHILTAADFALTLSPTPVAQPELAPRLAELAACTFDLASDLPIRTHLLRIAGDDHVLLLVMHHIASDGWSNGPLMRDLATAYSARLEDRGPDWEPLPVQYADYAMWQRELLGADDDPASLGAAQLAYWAKMLADLPEEVTLRGDRPRPVAASYRGDRLVSSLPSAVHQQLLALVRESGASLFMAVQAATAAVLTRSGAGTDVPIGSPVAGRTEEGLEDLVGFFVNTLALRTDTSGDPSFTELLGRVRDTDLAAWAHQDLPFDRLVEELNPERSAARHPLFQVMLSLGEASMGAPELPGLRAEVAFADTGISKFDLTFGFAERYTADGRPDGIDLAIEYATDLYDASTVQALADRLLRLIAAAAADPATRIGELDVLGAEERRRLFAGWTGAGREVPEGALHELFVAQAARTPDAIALHHGERSVTYAELDAWSNGLARRLAGAGVGPEAVVGVLMERSVELVVSLLAVLKAGGVYAPLNVTDPAARLASILADADARVLLVDAVHQDHGLLAEPGDLEVLLVDGELEPGEAPVVSTDPDQWAYVMFTSGSTGVPKGVMATHRGVAELAFDARWDGGDHLSTLFHSPHTFDAATYELWVPLLRGGRVTIAGRGGVNADVVQHAVGTGVRALFLTTALFNLIAEERPEAFAGLGEVLTGGEAASPRAMRRVLEACPKLRLGHVYGPTETTTYATHWPLIEPESVSAAPPIGRPLDNTRTYVLDEGLRPVPTGVVGELYIGGAGLARGYLNRPGQTSERFVADPYGPDGSRMYRTGDLVRWIGEGAIEFVGRADQQVKLRGFRIEPGEIEAVLVKDPAVTQAAVLVREDRPGDKRLVGYVVVPEGAPVDTEALRRAVGAVLPEYMVPSAFVTVDALPLTSNGKLDRAALPAPRYDSATGGRGPRNPVEEVLCSLFAEVLGASDVGIDDNFFHLGGHSLLATRLVTRIRDALNADLTVRDLFENATIAELAPALADHIGTRRPGLVAVRRPERIPLSFAQQRLWFLGELEGASATYNIPLAIRLTGDLDQQALRLALGDVVERHESLRTVFEVSEGRPFQRILPAEAVDLDLAAVTVAEQDTQAVLAELAARVFDLSAEVPLRAFLVEESADSHVLLLVVHHIASDGWSNGPLMRDLATAYTARVEGGAPGWGPLPVQYADYALWQRELLGAADDPTGVGAAQLAHWAETLADLPDEVTLRGDRPRPTVASHRGGRLDTRLASTAHERLLALVREAGASLFMAVQAATAAVLTRSGAGNDVVLGSPSAGRTDPALDDLVGFFVNTLVLRTDTSGDPSFVELLARVRDTDLAAWAHQDLPFDRLVEELNPERSAARHPLFQVMLTLGEEITGTPQLAGIKTELAFADTAISKFDLTLSFTEQHTADGRPDGIDLAIEYATDLYDASTVQALADRLLRLIEAAAADPATPIGALDILTPDERARLLDWGGAIPDTPLPGLVERFAAQAARTPDAVALHHDEQSVTYAELSIWSNQLAHHLTSRGVTPGSLVAIHLERTPHLIAALLAVLSAGAGYTLLDPQFPVDRLNGVLAQVEPSVLVTQTHMQTLDTRAVVVDLSRETPEISARPAHRPDVPGRPDAIACVMFTSGSTGAPKGVAAPQRALAATFLGPDYLRFGPGQTYLQCSPMSWDAFALEVFGALLHGGTCVLQPGETTEPRYIAELVAHHGITTLQMSASLFNHMVDEHPAVFGHLQEAMTAGEAASPAHTARVIAAHPHLRVVNGYGPAESMGFSTSYAVPGTDATAAVPIGRPIAGKQGYVLDANLALVAPGVPGELYLGGGGLALGYVGRTDLTAERFVASPYGAPGSRLYRTGDLVRWNPQGELEYLGRADQQVKLRGFRIEPGEIEAVLLGAQDVAQAAVVLREDQPGDQRLVAYAVPAEGRTVETEALRRLVAATLPEYMVPSAFVALKALPLTTNGKLDRGALPEPRYDSAAGGRAPRTPTEAMLCTLFAEILGVPRVSIDDNFFHLGGHSFLASRLVSRIQEVWEVPITVRDLFRQPVVHALADGISTGMGEDELDTVLPLRAARGEGVGPAPLFCIHPISGMSWCYSGLLRHLDENRPIIGLQARQLTALHDAPGSMEAMADQYVAEIRMIQPEGPYHLLGWSFGGLVAHAVAVRLEAAGERVGSLSLLDSYPLPEGFEPSPVTGRDVLIALLGTAGAELDLAGADGPPDTAELLEVLRVREPVLGMLERPKAAAVVEATARNLAMRQRHEPAGRFTGPMLFFEAGRTPWPVTPQAAWAPYTSEAVEVHEIDCEHWEMTQAEPLGIVGKALAEQLRD